MFELFDSYFSKQIKTSLHWNPDLKENNKNSAAGTHEFTVMDNMGNIFRKEGKGKMSYFVMEAVRGRLFTH